MPQKIKREVGNFQYTLNVPCKLPTSNFTKFLLKMTQKCPKKMKIGSRQFARHVKRVLKVAYLNVNKNFHQICIGSCLSNS